ncbi:PEP-CTERM sorting domain-containing protein [Oscillatoria acuminata]|uniref:PEP-CTERM putative exosortase interaction domain-containing protein n=1 Tax=Oscillatoria acuminata PCC 6304 TaxID=56110 RepID=K9TGD2_9CYAN|nr:PEP-CTERM sorting domain-containing protein [Oscillatoria acuminata]AFY81912.1 PEP-CTERM putative exosortase interaction domain-containing protein [Oscillatoria acuminata PCC 6304]
MARFFFSSPRLFALSAAVLSSLMGVLSATEAKALTFKGTIYETFFPGLEGFEIEYTLADGIFDTIISSPPNTYFTDGYQNFGPEPSLPKTLVPQVVTEFKWSISGTLEPLEVERSIFGITDAGLFLQILDPNEPPIYKNIFMSTIQAPEGLPLSACKTQACDASADFGGKGGLYGSRMTHIPVTKSQSVPEPSAAIALSFVGALLLKRRRNREKDEKVLGKSELG